MTPDAAQAGPGRPPVCGGFARWRRSPARAVSRSALGLQVAGGHPRQRAGGVDPVHVGDGLQEPSIELVIGRGQVRSEAVAAGPLLDDDYEEVASGVGCR